ncbi:helix-turn-helix domain-containing protein [Stieleria magnilauensis]|uniref:Helix-turn-helix domain protein n=1 Tax=Stieleria magnilauensis TaxID=2527963 RepID=A0ABX5XZI3_9BACT|nr:Helix-turn-helix domain protein [Planctomycetes bacterium TBK1r]
MDDTKPTKLAQELFPGMEYVRPMTVAHTLDISPSTVYRWISRGLLRSVRISGSVRVRAVDVATMLRK